MQELLVTPRESLVSPNPWFPAAPAICLYPSARLVAAAPKIDQLTPPRPKVQKTSVTETVNLKTAVEAVIKPQGTRFCINEVCQRFDLKRRVFFDFLWIINSIGMCTKVSAEQYVSNGLEVSEAFWRMAQESASVDQRPISIVFDCRGDSSLSYVTRQFILLFFYLDVDVLDLRKVARLFVHGNEKLKTMMRKLYSISVALEAVNIVTRTMKPAEVKLIRRAKEDPLSILNITALLNNQESAPAIVLTRRAEFDRLARAYGCV